METITQLISFVVFLPDKWKILILFHKENVKLDFSQHDVENV